MFDSSIEIKKNRFILHGDIDEIRNRITDLDKKGTQNESVEIQISFFDLKEFNAFKNLDYKIFDNKHLVLNISSSIFDIINVAPIIKNFLIKNILFLKGSIQMNLYKPEIMIPKVIDNNNKIYNKFHSSDLYYWNPTYNTLNESLVLSNNLLNELNQVLLNKKEINNKMQKIQDIVKDL